MELFTRELLDYLPPKARSKAIELDAARSAAWAVLRHVVDQMDDARMRRDAAQASARQAEERFPDRRVSEEDRARLNGPVARADEELTRLRDQHERASRRFQEHAFLEKVVSWVRDAKAARVRLKDGGPINVKTADAAKQIELIRRRLDEIGQEWDRVADAPRPLADARAAMIEEIDQIAARGAPRIDPRVRDGAPIRLSRELALSVHGESLIGNPAEVIVWLCRDQIVAKCLEAIGDAEAAGALNDDAREAEFERLNVERLKLEREEAALVAAAAENGLAIPHRSDIDPRAVLMVEEV
ncbi:hypothetical protein ASE36_18990 [Rhizobium sp. Root274]|uniref:hypothetical protein n=1 Tax=unclassified Rhizobium TaxID=2613769 RepID=UPI000715CCB0|nr:MULTISPECIES: hypothetical protein [unclassified Rhizobium]KQW27032.1 hypothetical protein ASC71_20085 [Rhizobium sp. Root1240]KRD27906.1 hypothetical protein ASE36_18990 [Rhizobium sp. Root274]